MLKRIISSLIGSQKSASTEDSPGGSTDTGESDESTDEFIDRLEREANWEFDRVDEQPYTHYTDAIEDVKQLKREKRHDEVEELLLWCIDYVEAEARDLGYSPARAYYRHLAIVYRKDVRYEDEVEILERYVDICEEVGEEPRAQLIERLDRACELASEE